MSPEPFPDKVRRLIQEARDRGEDVSQERVALAAWDLDGRGTSASMFKQVMNGRRALTPMLIEGVARALDVPPTEFVEYRLAMTRRALDERQVGLEQALLNLRAIETDDE